MPRRDPERERRIQALSAVADRSTTDSTVPDLSRLTPGEAAEFLRIGNIPDTQLFLELWDKAVGDESALSDVLEGWPERKRQLEEKLAHEQRMWDCSSPASKCRRKPRPT